MVLPRPQYSSSIFNGGRGRQIQEATCSFCNQKETLNVMSDELDRDQYRKEN